MKDFKTYDCACTGGTFMLHKGHERLLSLASSMISDGGLLVVGLTTEEYLDATKKPFRKKIPSYDQREDELSRYLDSICRGRYQIIPLNNRAENCSDCIYGRRTEAIIVGGNDPPVKRRADQLNERRVMNGFCGVDIVVVSPALDENGARISSTNIRANLITRDGKGMGHGKYQLA